MQGVNQQPITGLIGTTYSPVTAAEAFFQRSLVFDYAGTLMAEFLTGTGKLKPISGPLVVLPSRSHMMSTQAYNRAYMAFSNLISPTSGLAVYDLKSGLLDPFGLKPFGGTWLPKTTYEVGEMVTPTTANGHTYRCIVGGTTTDVTEPTWPLNENGTVIDGGVTWEEYTMVLANRILAPNAPVVGRVSAGGSFPDGQDVYIGITFTNAQGETPLSLTSVLVKTVSGDAVSVVIPPLSALPTWMQGLTTQYAITGANIYEIDVATGSQAPPITQYEQVGSFPLGTTQNVTETATSSIFPPATNTARVTSGMLPTPDVEPPLSRQSGGGTFVAGRDVYVLQTYTNHMGETLPGPANVILNTATNDAVSSIIAGLDGYELTGVNLYEADVPTGTDAPDSSLFALVGSFAIGATATITSPATGHPPPTTNTTGTAGNIQADQPTGGIGDTQGYRYAAVVFENRNGTKSGFTIPSVVYYDVDENGWELAAFNIAIGPENTMNRIVMFTVADAVSAGPFFYIATSTTSAGITMTSTVIPDNTTTTATFNFTDQFLLGSTDGTYLLQVIAPPTAVDIAYLPSVDRMVLTGIPGFYSGNLFSLAADAESFRLDNGLVNIGSDDGQRAICVREFRGTIYSLRERSGFVITPSDSNPSAWSANQRWSKVGPCGPRAVDTCGEFMIFIHRSGIYIYKDDAPECVSKEIPRFWNTINWKAEQTIWAAIDVEENEVHIGLPVGGSNVPNIKLTLNYAEGWNNPLIFSRYTGKETVIEACRKYSVDDCQAFLGLRIERNLPDTPVVVEGPVNTTEEIQRFRTSQFLMGSSGPDGAVQAIQPGVYDDNGAGIDWQMETACPESMMSVCQITGFNANALGNGTIFPSFLAARAMVTDFQTGSKSKEIKMRPFDLSPDQGIGISRGCQARTNERWRLHLHNGAAPGVWASIKYACLFSRPVFDGRSELEG